MIEGTLEAVNARNITVDGEVYEVPRDGKVISGDLPDHKIRALVDLKAGMLVALHGPPKGPLHTIRIIDEDPEMLKEYRKEREREQQDVAVRQGVSRQSGANVPQGTAMQDARRAGSVSESGPTTKPGSDPGGKKSPVDGPDVPSEGEGERHEKLTEEAREGSSKVQGRRDRGK